MIAANSATLDVIWEVDDDLWTIRELIVLETYPPQRTGRPRVDFRQVFNAAVYRLRTGCQWNRMPAELGSDSSNHRWFQRWREDGVLEKIWAVLVERCDALGVPKRNPLRDNTLFFKGRKPLRALKIPISSPFRRHPSERDVWRTCRASG